MANLSLEVVELEISIMTYCCTGEEIIVDALDIATIDECFTSIPTRKPFCWSYTGFWIFYSYIVFSVRKSGT